MVVDSLSSAFPEVETFGLELGAKWSSSGEQVRKGRSNILWMDTLWHFPMYSYF